jgi:hypothetical protein
MSKEKEQNSNSKKPQKIKKTALAQALKENLHRRKTVKR